MRKWMLRVALISFMLSILSAVRNPVAKADSTQTRSTTYRRAAPRAVLARCFARHNLQRDARTAFVGPSKRVRPGYNADLPARRFDRRGHIFEHKDALPIRNVKVSTHYHIDSFRSTEHMAFCALPAFFFPSS